ncbi:MAG: hypothetical protein IKM23_07290 [Bacteroidales bacterium]|jgi:hypothetical protein|nr:hypothetical protein [Clostridia bacterium]MBR3919207.1 hypothetical protein [Clostridia bacterium]MBR6775496.1 hypothetical protein [Bacteroidales bacterium]
MREAKRVITVDSFQHDLMINGINEFRNMLIEKDMPIEDVNELLQIILDAPLLRKRRFDREER